MNKIIFAFALLAILTLTLAIGVTILTQTARVEINQNCTKTFEECKSGDIVKTLKNILKCATNELAKNDDDGN
jgi:uncharacterized membrane protein